MGDLRPSINAVRLVTSVSALAYRVSVGCVQFGDSCNWWLAPCNSLHFTTLCSFFHKPVQLISL